MADSGVSSGCKHILGTLSYFMNEDGKSCFPSIETLCAKTGRGKTSIHKYLNEAEQNGWISRSRRPANGSIKKRSKWSRNKYVAIIPRNPTGSLAETVKTEHDSKTVQPGSASGQKCVRTPNTNSPDNSPTTPQEEDELKNGFGVDDEKDFNRLVSQHPDGWIFYSAKSKELFLALSASDRREAVERHEEWLCRMKQAGREKPPSLSDYLELKIFKKIEPEAKRAILVTVKPFSKEMLGHRLWLLNQGPTGTFKPGKNHEVLNRQGRADLLKEAELRALYPEVAELDRHASNGDETKIRRTEEIITGIPEKIRRDTEEWIAWKKFHSKMNWPWIQPPNYIVYLTMPLTLDEFKDLVSYT